MSQTPPLYSLIWEVTQRCNHLCRHCYNVWQPDTPAWPCSYPRGELDTAQSLALIDKALDETGCPHVTLTGGEPLLRSDLLQIVAHLRRRGVRLTLISNGRLLSEELVVELIEGGVSMFELPLLSRRREMHDRLCGAKEAEGIAGAFDAVLAAAARIRYHGGAWVAVFVATRLNIADLDETIRLAFAFGAGGLMLNRLNVGGRGRAYVDELLPSVEQVKAALAVAEAARVELNWPISCSIAIQPCLIDLAVYPHLGFGFCAAGTARAYYTLDPLGNVRPCNHTPTILGNLFRESWADIVSPERLAPFMQAMPSFCKACRLRETCQGGCKAAAQVYAGSLSEPEPFLCRHLDQAQPVLSD